MVKRDAGPVADLGDMGAIGQAAVDLDSLTPLIALNAQHRETLLKRAGGVLSAAEVGTLLNVTRKVVEKKRRTWALLALRARRRLALPIRRRRHSPCRVPPQRNPDARYRLR